MTLAGAGHANPQILGVNLKMYLGRVGRGASLLCLKILMSINLINQEIFTNKIGYILSGKLTVSNYVSSVDVRSYFHSVFTHSSRY